MTKQIVFNILLITDARSVKILSFVINKEIITKKEGIMKRKNLEELKELLIVVDMVNGFAKEGAMADPNIMKIVPEIERLISIFQEEGKEISFIKDTHDLGCKEFDRYPEHCVKGTKEAELVDELKPYELDHLVYEKNSTSAIYARNFQRDIDLMKNLKEVVITGCCTDICVLNLAIPLQNYFDEQNRRVDIIVPQNAVETYDSPQHQKDEYNKMAFSLMEQAGIQLVKKYKGGKKYGKK